MYQCLHVVQTIDLPFLCSMCILTDLFNRISLLSNITSRCVHKRNSHTVGADVPKCRHVMWILYNQWNSTFRVTGSNCRIAELPVQFYRIVAFCFSTITMDPEQLVSLSRDLKALQVADSQALKTEIAELEVSCSPQLLNICVMSFVASRKRDWCTAPWSPEQSALASSHWQLFKQCSVWYWSRVDRCCHSLARMEIARASCTATGPLYTDTSANESPKHWIYRWTIEPGKLTALSILSAFN